MGTKFTPGPWVVERVSGCRTIASLPCLDEDRRQFFTMDTVPSGRIGYTHGLANDRQDKANAHLIAAAPELLEALQEVVALSDRKHKAWDKAKAAIAKATR